MAQLRQGFGLDLADALASDAELASNLLKRAVATVLQPETQLQHLALA